MGYSPWGHKESDTTEHTHPRYLTSMLEEKVMEALLTAVLLKAHLTSHSRMSALGD